MKKRYTTPDIEITLFSTADIITLSEPSGSTETDDENISTASLEQAETPQVNNFEEYFN